jgi:hypothetical protein
MSKWQAINMLHCSVILAAMKLPRSKIFPHQRKSDFSAASDSLNRAAHAGMKPVSCPSFDDVCYPIAPLHSMNTYAA